MYLTTHPLERVLPREFVQSTGWPATARGLLPDAPVAHWTGVQLGSSSGVLVAAWATEREALAAAVREGSPGSRVVMGAGSVAEVDGAQFMAGRSLVPGAMQLTWFAGPRTEAHLRADAVADQRIADDLRDLPGLCGAVLCSGENVRLIVSFADSESTLQAAVGRIMASELGPDEDPALLPGPETVRIYALVDSAGSIDVFPSNQIVAGGVR